MRPRGPCSHDWAAIIPRGVRSLSFAEAMADKRAVCTLCGTTQDEDGNHHPPSTTKRYCPWCQFTSYWVPSCSHDELVCQFCRMPERAAIAAAVADLYASGIETRRAETGNTDLAAKP